MRLPTEGVIITPPPLHETIARLRQTLKYDLNSWAELLHISERDCALVECGKKDIDIISLAEVSHVLNVSLDLIANGKLDWSSIAAQAAGNQEHLPEKYQIAPLSRKRTSITVLDYLEDFYGWQTRLAVLRNLQVSEPAFQDPHSLINIRFLKDTLSFLSSRGFTESDIEAMGAYSVVTNHATPIGARIAACRNPAEAYELLIDEVVPVHFDRNHKYRLISVKPTECALKIELSEELLAFLAAEDVSGPELCAYRRGVASSFPGYLGLPYSKVTELRCMHRGDSDCQFKIDYSGAAALKAMRPLATQPSLPRSSPPPLRLLPA